MAKKQLIDILFCGLVREPEMFKKSILDMVSLRDGGLVNQIFFSTWKSEVQKYPKIFSFLKKYNVRIIESEELKIRGYGNIWCQMKALDVGLQQINKNHFVLKTRTDVYIQPFFLKRLFKNKEKLLKIKKDLPKGNIFKYKIWVSFFELKTLFYLSDVCFFGYHDDLKLLINYKDSYDTKYKIGGGISHIRRFIHPFLKDYPILYHSLKKGYVSNSFLKSVVMAFSKNFFEIRNFKILRKIGQNHKIRIFKRQLKEDVFLDCLAAYYSILYSHFYIDNRSVKNQIIFNETHEVGPKLNPLNFEKNLTKEKYYAPLSGQIYDYDMKLLENICNKNLEKTPFSIKLMKAIDKFNSQK